MWPEHNQDSQGLRDDPLKVPFERATRVARHLSESDHLKTTPPSGSVERVKRDWHSALCPSCRTFKTLLMTPATELKPQLSKVSLDVRFLPRIFTVE